MGPEMMIISAVLAAAGTAVSAAGQASAMKGQAAAEQQRAAIEKQWADRRATEEKAVAQRGADEEQRKAGLAQSRLTALAGASGTRPDDQTVMDLWGDISKEGDYNAAQVTAQGAQKAAGIDYQADLNSWTADANAKIKRSAAKTTLIAGLLSAGGQMAGGMSGRYGGPKMTGTTGYGGGYG
jgi:hypothetical protein